MNALVVNCSAPHYNLGCAKLAGWLRDQGWQVEEWAGDPGMFAEGYDLVALSAIFSWHAPVARRVALQVRAHADVWCGGPGMYTLQRWWTRETGLVAHAGLDWRWERQRGDYRMTFASRGCPVGCWFCLVPKLEGTTFAMDPDFQPAPILCDNNLSALPESDQEYIIARYQSAGVRLLDANSGFEPRTFDNGTYARWRPILRGPWRFALDESNELAAVEGMMAILQGESRNRKRVYVLIGNEPIEACRERAEKVLAWGGEPFCQPLMPLNALVKRPSLRHDWTQQALSDFARFYNRHIWKYASWQEYRREVRSARSKGAQETGALL